MTWVLQYYVEVESDFNSTTKWYQEQQDGLQIRFATEVSAVINKIYKNPLIYQIKHANVRIAYLNVFPFGVHYYIDETNMVITIIGILHQHRNPKISYER